MKIALSILLFALTVSGANRYVDSAATGANNGTSWANAWTAMNSITGLSAGDVVYISGGAAGSSKTYTCASLGAGYPGLFVPIAGVTYQIGQEAGHNGTAIFNGTPGTNVWVYAAGYPANVTISGDAGDGSRHFVLTNYGGFGIADGATNWRICYVDGGRLKSGIGFNPSYRIEFDHNRLFIAATNSTVTVSLGLTYGDGFGTNKWHDNLIYVPNCAGSGPDILDWNGNAFDVYNETWITYETNIFEAGFHMDGWQGQGGGWIRFWGNYIYGITNYALFGDLTTATGFTNLWIFNNVLVNNGGGIIVGKDAWGDQDTRFENVIIANNTIDNGVNSGGQSLAFGSTKTNSLFLTSLVANNVIVSGQDVATVGNLGTPQIANLHLTTAQASNVFAVYRANLTNYYLPLASASTIIGLATNLNSYFATDFAGTVRGTAWDIGAYEYAAAPEPPAAGVTNVFGPVVILGDLRWQ